MSACTTRTRDIEPKKYSLIYAFSIGTLWIVTTAIELVSAFGVLTYNHYASTLITERNIIFALLDVINLLFEVFRPCLDSVCTLFTKYWFVVFPI